MYIEFKNKIKQNTTKRKTNKNYKNPIKTNKNIS
jgi:hypothetical protein